MCGVFVVGALIRIYGMTTQSLWFDELFSVHFSRPGLPLADLIARYEIDFHPLLYPTMLRLWFELFGWTDIAARSLSVCAGIAGIPAMAWLGYRIGGSRLGLAAAAIVAFNPFHLVYSQEVRPYALVFVFAALSFAALSALIERPSAKWASVYVLATALAFHTHYYALLMTCGQLAAAIFVEYLTTRRKLAFTWLVISGGVMALVLLPWLGPVRRAAGVTEYWPAKPRPGFVFEYLHDYFGNGIVLTSFVLILLVALPFVLRLHRSESGKPESGQRRQPQIAAVLALACALVFLVTYIRSVFIVPMLMARFTMVLLPAILVLVCLSAIRLPKRFAAFALVILISGSALQIWSSGFPKKPLKEQWREAIYEALDDEENQHPNNVLLSPIPQGFQFYAAMRSDELVVNFATLEELRKARTAHEDGGGIWLLIARNRQPEPEAIEFLKREYRNTRNYRFFKTSAQYWLPKAAMQER